MDPQHINFGRIEKAIHYINDHFKEQPALKDIAGAAHLSPFHFQRLFSDWAGVSPKKFMQYISLEYAKDLLKNRNSSLLDAAHDTGFSGSGRLHDLFVSIEGMTPGEYKNGGAGLSIHYSFTDSPFGQLIVASTPKGVCHMAFDNSQRRALDELQQRFPNADYSKRSDSFQRDALSIFSKDWFSRDRRQLDAIKLHLAGTPFQIKVWETLLKIPLGSLATYGDIASGIGRPKAARAVGTAIGNNPVAYLIPCHRVIQTSGQIGGYRWRPVRKSAIIGWEAARVNAD